MTAGEHEHDSSDVGGAPQIVDESEMPTVGSVQLPSDEEILYDLRPSWAAYWKSLTVYGLITLASMGLLFPVLLIPWLKRRKTRYVVTTERIIIVEGMINTQTTEQATSKINTIVTGATWLERWLGYGHLEMETHHGARLQFNGIPDHENVARTIRGRQSGR